MNIFEWIGIWFIALSAQLATYHYPAWEFYVSAVISLLFGVIIPYFNKEGGLWK